MTLLLMLLLKSLFVFALSGLILLCLRRASASARHLVCLLTLAALLALPLFSLTLPSWHVAGLQMRDAEATLVYQEPTPVRPSPALPVREGKEFEQEAHLASAASSSGSSLTGKTPAKQGSGFLMQGGEFLAFYLLGVLLAALRPLLGLWGIAHLRRACAPVSDAPTLSVSADCAAALRLMRLPRLCRADVPVPMTWGWRQPVVLLPLGSETWPEGRLRSVLLHEMAHLRRRDWTCHRLADFACALYWFHPLVWLTARRLRAESEVACDDLVLASGIAAPDYARHLLEIASALSRPLPSQSAIAMAQTPHIKRRILMVLNKTHSRRTVTRRALLVALVPSAAALLTLAALRPGVKAQAAPTALADGASHSGASVAVPSEGSRLNFNFGPGTNFVNHGNGKMDITTGPDLTINSTTLLAGLSDAGKPGSPWWSANGALLPTPVYDTNAYHTGDHVGDSSTHNVSFAFRLPPTASGITTQFKLPQSKGYSSDGAWPGKSQSDAQHTESQMFASTGGARIVTAAFPPALKKTSIQIGIAAGPWKTAASNPNPSSAFSTNNGDQDFILGAAEQTATGLVLTLTTNSTDDLRVVARDMQGNELLPADNLGGSINGMDQITVHFSQPLSQIKVFEVQTRPFVWIGFRDIALQPVQNSAAVSSAEGQTPWTSVRLTQNEPGEVSHTEVRITPTVPGTHPDPPVTGKLVDGPGQFSSLSITPWKYDKAHSLGVKFTYTPSRTDKTDPATIHLLTKTGVVAAVIRYYPAW